ncbi:hypothetical protein ACIRU8_15085 [Streptomyces sp. NPDC101175]|uniref:hypothetical protein n=1 Tax=Streptomyces sp. NPDC101175 TaxID=3366123 RepID=UPI0038351F28
MHVVQERQRRRDDLLATLRLFAGTGERSRDVFALRAYGVELGPQLVFGPTLLGSKIKVVVLFAVEDPEPPRVLLAQFLGQLRIAR